MAGKLKENERTPSAASSVPEPKPEPAGAAVAAGAAGAAVAAGAVLGAGAVTARGAIAAGRVALSCAVMNERSSVGDLAGILRSEVERYPEGRKLPSSRALVERHQVSPVTVSRAIAVLAAEGLVVSRPGAGVFRAAAFAGTSGPPPAAPPPARPGDLSWQEVALSADGGLRLDGAQPLFATLNVPPPDVIDLNGGYPHAALLPERLLAAALARAGRRPGAWDRPPVDGLTELRGWFARDIGGNNGPLGAGDVLITAGGQSALTIALRSLAAPGAPVLVESPTYPGILAVARAAGLRVVPVPVDEDGVRTDQLAAAFDATRARLFVCQPLFQNPTGAVLSPNAAPRCCGSPARPARSSSRTTSPAGSCTPTPPRCPGRSPPTTRTASWCTCAR